MIREIKCSDWPQIMAIQTDVYHTITPEPLAALCAKWQRSPELCFVYVDEDERILGYLLAHTWSGALPKLDVLLDESVPSSWVFLHDLAVARSGRGIGRALFRHLLSVVSSMSWPQVKLVSIQDSEPFWSSLGFRAHSESVAECYGDDAVVMIRPVARTNV